MKVQLVVAKKSKRILYTAHDKGKTHDFKVLKKSKLPSLRKGIKKKLDSGYKGAEKLHGNCDLPKKGSKCKPLTEKEKAVNCKLAKEHVIGRIKVFRMMAEGYRNRRQRHTLRVKLICAIYNFEL